MPKATIRTDYEAKIESKTTTLIGKAKTVNSGMQIEVTNTTVKVTGAISIKLVSGPSSINVHPFEVTVVRPMIKLN